MSWYHLYVKQADGVFVPVSIDVDADEMLRERQGALGFQS